MSDWLLARLPRDPGAPLTWAGVDRRGTLTTPPGSGDAAGLAAVAGTSRVVLLVPGEDVLHLAATLPATNDARLAQLLPYALEEQIAEDIESQHFAAGSRLPDGTLAVDVVARARMDEWLALQGEWGVTFAAIHSESDLAPSLAGHLTLLVERDQLTLRVPGRRPVLLPMEDLWLSLELGLGAQIADLAQYHAVVYATAVDWQRHSAQVEALRDRFASLKVQLLSSGVLPLLAQQFVEAKPINLRQGIYAPPRQASGSWRAWRLAAILAGVLFGLHLLSQGLELRSLKSQERELDAALSQTLQGVAPGERYGTDLRRRMEKRLAVASAGGAQRDSLLGMLTAVAKAHDSAPNTKIEAMNYRKGSIEMRVSGPDAGSLDRINQALRSSGLKSDLTSGSPGKDSYEGRMQISAGPK